MKKSSKNINIIPYILEKIDLYGKTDISKINFGYSVNEVLEQCLPSLMNQKDKRTKNDILLICSLFSYFDSFVKPLRSLSIQLNDIFYNVASNLSYQKVESNQLILRYGEEGKEFFLILSGVVDVLVTKEVKIILTKLEYLRYIALLIYYKENELLKYCLEENYNSFKLVLKENNNSSIYQLKKSYKIYYNKDLPDLFIDSNNYFDCIPDPNGEFVYTKKNLLDLIGKGESYKKLKDENDLNISTKEYMERLKLFKNENFANKETIYHIYNEELNKWIDFINPDLNQEINVTIYNYSLINQLTQGSFFGDQALLNKDSKRTATVISKTECQFGILCKEEYDLSIKDANEVHKKEILNFIEESEAFKKLSSNLISYKYYNYFVYKKTIKGDSLIEQNTKINNIILVKSGEYEMNFVQTLLDLSKIINYIYESKIKNKAPPLLENDPNYKLCCDLRRKITKDISSLIKEEVLVKLMQKFNSRLNEAYTKKSELKVHIISSGEVIGFKSYEDVDGKSLFSIKCITSEGETLSVSKELYMKQFYTYKKVQIHISIYDYIKCLNLLNRLIELRQSKLTNILKCQSDKIYDSLNKMASLSIRGNDKKVYKRTLTTGIFSHDNPLFKNQFEMNILNKNNENTTANENPTYNTTHLNLLTNKNKSHIYLSCNQSHIFNQSNFVPNKKYINNSSSNSFINLSKSPENISKTRLNMRNFNNSTNKKNDDSLTRLKKRYKSTFQGISIEELEKLRREKLRYFKKTHLVGKNKIHKKDIHMISEFENLSKMLPKYCLIETKNKNNSQISNSIYKSFNSTMTNAILKHKKLNRELSQELITNKSNYNKNYNRKKNISYSISDIEHSAYEAYNNDMFYTRNCYFTNKNQNKKYWCNLYDINKPLQCEENRKELENEKIYRYFKLRNYDVIKKTRIQFARFTKELKEDTTELDDIIK